MKSLTCCDEEDGQGLAPCRVHVPVLARKRRSTATTTSTKKSCIRRDADAAPKKVKENSKDFSLGILVQPEKYFRARYISEGSRGPMRGDKDGAYPTIKICGYSGPAIVDVYLARLDGEVHDNVLVLGTNINGAGEVVTVDGGLQCIRVHTSTAASMEAVFSNISVRRLRKAEIENALRERGLDPENHECDRSVACLKFVAHIPGHEDVTVLSNPFQCSTQPGAPEILLVCPNTGSAGGNDVITLVGKRFKSGFKVRFFASTEQGHWEAWSSVDREVSNQGAAVIKVPKYRGGEVFMATKVQIEVRIGPEKEPYISEPAEFTYLPLSAMKNSCNSCANTAPALPLTPISQPTRSSRGESCSPAPVTPSLSTTSLPRVDFVSQSSSTTSASSCPSGWGVGDVLTEDILKSLTASSNNIDLFASHQRTPAARSAVRAEPNLFPSSVSDTNIFSSNASTASIVEPDPFSSNSSSVSVGTSGVGQHHFPSSASTHSIAIESDLFPSSASSASLSDMTPWSDLALLTGEPPLDFSLPPLAPFEFPDLGEERDWQVISQVVGEFTRGFPGVSNIIVEQLHSLVSQRCSMLHNIYRKCCQKAMELPDSSPSYLMKRQLNIYLPLLQGL